jgi:hypothetical protein
MPGVGAMKTSLMHLPEAKREKITMIAGLVQAGAPVEMVGLERVPGAGELGQRLMDHLG